MGMRAILGLVLTFSVAGCGGEADVEPLKWAEGCDRIYDVALERAWRCGENLAFVGPLDRDEDKCCRWPGRCESEMQMPRAAFDECAETWLNASCSIVALPAECAGVDFGDEP